MHKKVNKMPHKHCAWGTCNSDTRDNKKPHMEGVVFHKFPRPLDKENNVLQNDSEVYKNCQKWIAACARPHSDLNVDKIVADYRQKKYYYAICSKVITSHDSFSMGNLLVLSVCLFYDMLMQSMLVTA